MKRLWLAAVVCRVLTKSLAWSLIITSAIRDPPLGIDLAAHNVRQSIGRRGPKLLNNTFFYSFLEIIRVLKYFQK